jgi:hypothetical protein
MPLLALFGALLIAASPPAAPGPTLAREDTLYTSLPEVLVRAPRVTLAEILDRIARGERRRDSLLVDEQFVATMRLMHAKDDRTPPALLDERVVQVYRRKPNQARTIPLRHWSDPAHKHEQIQVSFRSDMSEEIVNFAFRAEARRDYRYRILGRDLVGNHVIYRIRFEPRSLLDPTRPSGLVWVDTNDFVILRQEVSFERSPAPLVLQGIDRMVIERQRVADFWVLHRVLMRLHFTVPMPRIGRLLEFAMSFDRYAVNQGLADSLFTTGDRE